MGNWLMSLLSDWKDRFTPYKGWIGELKNPEVLKADAMAGLTVALVLIPQSMAYAQLAGLPAYIGLYASFLPVMIAALFGSSRQLGTGPVAVVSLMSAAAMQPFAAQGVPVETIIIYSALLALMIGVFQLSLGLLRMGVLVDFLSHPVVVGFTNAGALIIATSQVPKLFGLGVKADQFEHSYEFWWATLISLPDTKLTTLSIGAFALLTLIVLKKYAPRLPGVLITVAVTTLLSWVVDYKGLGGSVIGTIPEGLPSFSLPVVEMSFQTFSSLAMTAAVIGLIGFVEAISIAKAMASQTRQRLSANQELVGQGLANIASGVFSGYAVSGSFSRSAVNFAAGAMTGFSSVVTGALVALTLLFLTPLLYHLPQATLAAVIIMAVVNLIKIAPIKHAWKVEPHDGIVAVVTFVATLAFAPHLDKGILLGVVLSLGLFLYRTMSPNLVEVARDVDGTMRDAKAHNLKTSDTVAVYRFDGDLYFANTGYMEGKLLNNVAQKPSLKVLVLDMESIDQVDSTGEEMLEKLSDRLKSAGIEFYIARVKFRVYEAFQRSGLARHIGEDRFFRERKYALNHAKELLGDAIDIEPFRTYMPLESK
ncbi:MAG TPA: SulP family inorganic anion transporter [Candidatus Thiothrix moscowensis]|uniref:SulP family inorganic anion transporter n=1 Tax=unclassified Thiothrix TaxID=2636184 RepID=UPI0025F62978|nr:MULTISPECIES: SulP family inorganic anion transporter [unclassified Thiothrix]HRJ52339.1 SulP family inorganic anion transporter [Candidatus Thiothrix moscowensis]HRJ92654.1 SulP family inorganic anion transporter [Candidatus Thiothrix moscowensis]